jgi:hypothetical protein
MTINITPEWVTEELKAEVERLKTELELADQVGLACLNYREHGGWKSLAILYKQLDDWRQHYLERLEKGGEE